MNLDRLLLAAALACVPLGCGRDAAERVSAEPGAPAAEAAPAAQTAAVPIPAPERAAPLSPERLMRVPEGSVHDPSLYPGLEIDRPTAPGDVPRGEPGLLTPSVSLRSEAKDSPIPGVTVESREVRGGVTVSPEDGRKPAVTVEGAVRQEEYEREAVAPRQDRSVGVRVEVPWPVPEKAR